MRNQVPKDYRPVLDERKSYCHGASELPLMGDTLADCLDRSAITHPDVEALVSCSDNVRLTYSQLRSEVDRFARALIALGIQRKDRIGIWSGNCTEWVIAQYAVTKIGAILVGINPALLAGELEYTLRQTGASLLIAASRQMADDCVALLEEHFRRPDSGKEAGKPFSLKHVVLLGPGDAPAWAVRWEDLLEQSETVPPEVLAARQSACQCDDPALILFTSGTTGLAKAATLSHHSIVNNGFFIGERLGYTPSDRLCQPIPMYHSMGCIAGTIAAVTHASTLVLPEPVFHPQSCLKAIEDEHCTSIYGVPSMFIAQLQDPAFAARRVASLRTGIIAGAPCSRETMLQIMERMHVPELTTCYGLTETRCLFQSRRDDPAERRAATAGVIHPYVECKIVDSNTGQIVPRGATGELCCRGYGTMLGYWNNDAATWRAIDSARWFHTGDLASLSHDGYLSIVGRIKDTIIRGGENVAPTEVEAVLMSCENIADACVVGVPDLDYGEELCAWIVLKEFATATDRDIRRFCRQHLARHKVPRHVMFIDQFPRTANGKVQKYLLREMAVGALTERAKELEERNDCDPTPVPMVAENSGV